MNKQTFRLVDPRVRYNAKRAIEEAPDGWLVELKEPTRSIPQNAKLHAMVADLIAHKPEGRDMKMDEWKVLLMELAGRMSEKPAPFKARFLPSLSGEGFTYVAPSTSGLRKREFNELIEAAYFYGEKHGVVWSEPNPFQQAA